MLIQSCFAFSSPSAEEELDKRLFGQQESIDRQNQDMDEVESFGRRHR